jgi:predicted GTPase
VLFVISQSDKAEPTSGGGQLSTAQKQNISRKICLLHELFQPVHPVCRVGPSAVGTAGDGRAND